MNAKPDSSALLEIARDTALGAARQIRPAHRHVVEDLSRDVKIEADRRLHQIITDLLESRSALPILSEEDEGSILPGLSAGRVWVVDPLDGSLNFSRGIPFCGISIGLWSSEGPVLGVIHDFQRNELFSGAVGGGAFLNGSPISVSMIDQKEKAILCTGFPTGADFSHDAVSNLVTDIQSFKKVRWLGSAALSLAYVAAGRADVYQENGIALWDVAAGLALVQAAGGTVSITRTTVPHRFSVRAGSPGLVRGGVFQKSTEVSHA